MKEFDKRIFRNQILFAKEHRPGEAALVDITADGSDVLVEEFGYFFNRIEVEFEGHFFPINFLILNRVLSWGFRVFFLRISAMAETDILRIADNCWRV